MNILITIGLAVVLTSLFGVFLVLVQSWSNNQLGERSRSACEIMGMDDEHCCQYSASCPEEIRSKCRHAKL